MVFATEPVTACLRDAISQTSASRPNPNSHPYRNSNSHQNQSQLTIELDEVEVCVKFRIVSHPSRVTRQTS